MNINLYMQDLNEWLEQAVALNNCVFTCSHLTRVFDLDRSQVTNFQPDFVTEGEMVFDLGLISCDKVDRCDWCSINQKLKSADVQVFLQSFTSHSSLKDDNEGHTEMFATPKVLDIRPHLCVDDFGSVRWGPVKSWLRRKIFPFKIYLDLIPELWSCIQG